MTRDEVIQLARDLGCEIPSGPEGMEFFFYPDELERFAELVATYEHERIIKANAPEIERTNAHIKALEDASALGVQHD